MTEYIERDAAMANRREYNLGGSYDNTELAVPVDAIKSIPAADVRPVVLCKDCKYAERVCMPDGRVWCNENLFSRLDEDFCSRGEKREES